MNLYITNNCFFPISWFHLVVFLFVYENHWLLVRKKFKFSYLNACNSLLLRIVVNILLLLMMNITIALLQHLCQVWSLKYNFFRWQQSWGKRRVDFNGRVKYSRQKRLWTTSYPSLQLLAGSKKKHFSTEEIGTMPTWVTTMKHHYNPQWHMFTWLTHHNLKQPTTDSL